MTTLSSHRMTIRPRLAPRHDFPCNNRSGVSYPTYRLVQTSLGTVYEPCPRFWLNQELILDRARICDFTARSEHEQSKSRYEPHPSVSLFYLVLMHVGSPLRT